MRENMWKLRWTWVTIISVGLWLISSTQAFNIESKHYTLYKLDDTSSMFGFSVAEYRDSNRRGWVIVGAPEAQTTQARVYRGGSVYRCDVANDHDCVQIQFDSQGHNLMEVSNSPNPYVQIDNKTLQWFGATVSTSSVDGGPILACAPRYVFFSIQENRIHNDSTRQPVGNRRDPVGTCWLTNNLTTSKEFSPCRTRHFGYHRQGSCQAGLGATLSKDGERLFIGAPGSWYWQGQLFSIPSHLADIPFLPQTTYTGQVYTQTVNNRGKVMFTKEGSPDEDDSYLGYTVTSGDFLGNGDVGTAVGMPRGHGLQGKIVFLTSNMTNHQNVTGEQMGAYFGYSLAVGDIDGDKLDDLIVGAPMFTIPNNAEMSFETGRIYVFYGKDRYKKWHARDGESNRGRFGLSVASLGDLDLDGFGDLAVGAPYAGPTGQGAVYIYYGTVSGISEKYSQVIYAADLETRVPIRTFGFSVSGGLDLDNNIYPDLVVGAYESGAAMFFRARPVIKMVKDATFIHFDSSSSSKLVSLEERNCRISTGEMVACLPLKTCFQYEGIRLASSYKFNIEYILDIKKPKNPRMFFIDYEGMNTTSIPVNADMGKPYCKIIKVYISPDISDKLTSLDAEMRISLKEDQWLMNDQSRNPHLQLKPVLAATSIQKDSIAIRKNCGSDNICEPDLRLSCTSNPTDYLLGSGKRLELDVRVNNYGEDAFEATYYLILPPGINYTKIELGNFTDTFIQCSDPSYSNNNTLKCDIGNPLRQGSFVNFKVWLQPSHVYGEKSTYDFYMNVNSTNPEPGHTMQDNYLHIPTGIVVDSNLSVEGESKPKDLYYNPSNYTILNATTDIEYGPSFVHNYTIRNEGPSTIEASEVFLIWPDKTLAGDEFVYLLEQPVVDGNIKCATANANYLSLKIESKRKTYGAHYATRPGYQPLTSQNKNIHVHTGDHADSTVKTSDQYNNRDASSTATAGGVWIENGGIVKQSQGQGSSVLIQTGLGSLDQPSVYTTAPSLTHTGNGHMGGIHHTFTNSNQTNGQIGINIENRQTGGQNSLINSHQTESERRYNEFHNTQEENRRKEYMKQQEEKQLRLQEEEFIAQQKREEEMRKQRGEFDYGRDKIIGDREEHIGAADLNIQHTSHVSSTSDLQRFIEDLKKTVGYEESTYQGNKYIDFLARFIILAEGKEYIELKDGRILPIQNSYGDQSYVSMGQTRSDRYIKIQAQIIRANDGKFYGLLSDGRRFPLYYYSSPLSWNNYRQQGTSENTWGHKTYDGGETYESHIHEEKRITQQHQQQRVTQTYEQLPNNYQDSYRRLKRQLTFDNNGDMRQVDPALIDKVLMQSEYFSDDQAILRELGLCANAKCLVLRCFVGRLEKSEEVSISARFKIRGTTLNKISAGDKLNVTTTVYANVTKLPFIGKPHRLVSRSHQVVTVTEPTISSSESGGVPLWVVVVSAVAGTIILLLLIYLLYKCGFFKRNRPTDAPERQPLNRNGHFHGDDHM